MRKLLGVLLGLAFALTVVGFFRGWFSVSRAVEETKTDIHLTIDRQRIREDAELARDKIDRLRGRAGDDSEPGDSRPDDLEIPAGVDPQGGSR